MDKETYYQNELKKLSTKHLCIKLESNGGQTKWMNVNKDSIEDLITFLTKVKDELNIEKEN